MLLKYIKKYFTTDDNFRNILQKMGTYRGANLIQPSEKNIKNIKMYFEVFNRTKTNLVIIKKT